jgi:hypothetical protein
MTLKETQHLTENEPCILEAVSQVRSQAVHAFLKTYCIGARTPIIPIQSTAAEITTAVFSLLLAVVELSKEETNKKSHRTKRPLLPLDFILSRSY